MFHAQCCSRQENMFILVLLFQANQRMALQTNVDIMETKASLLRPHTAHAVQRSTLGEIGNKVSAIQISDGSKGPIKKEIVHINAVNTRLQKAITKTKATSSLRALVEEHPKQVCNFWFYQF